MREIFASLKNIKIIEETVTIKSSLKEKQITEIEALGFCDCSDVLM